MMRRLLPFSVALTLSAICAAGAARPVHTPVVVIVPLRLQVSNLTSGDLRRIFLGDISRWSDGHRIVPMVRPSDTEEESVLLRRVVRMSDIDYSQHWLGQVFRGEAAAAPPVMRSAEAMKRAIAASPSGIGILLQSEILPEDEHLIRVLQIDGKLPGDRGYPLDR